MEKKIVKKILAILLVIMLIIILSSEIFAVSDFFTQSEDWISTGKSHTNTTTDTTQLKKASNTLYNIFTLVYSSTLFLHHFH